MDEWRKLTYEEKELLLPYCRLKQKPAIIFFTAIKCFGIFQLTMGIIYLIQNIKEFPIFNVIFFIIALLTGFGMFYWIPNKLIYLASREVNAIENDNAQVIETFALEKDRFAPRNGQNTNHHYHIKVALKGLKRDEYIRIDRGAYLSLDEYNSIKVFFFPLTENSPLAKEYMIAFDHNLKFIKQINNKI